MHCHLTSYKNQLFDFIVNQFTGIYFVGKIVQELAN